MSRSTAPKRERMSDVATREGGYQDLGIDTSGRGSYDLAHRP